jgi:hypothetical protein
MAIEKTDIEEQAMSPAEMRTEEGMVKERSVDELIKADRYNKQNQATKPPYGLRIAIAKPRGTV